VLVILPSHFVAAVVGVAWFNDSIKLTLVWPKRLYQRHHNRITKKFSGRSPSTKFSMKRCECSTEHETHDCNPWSARCHCSHEWARHTTSRSAQLSGSSFSSRLLHPTCL